MKYLRLFLKAFGVIGEFIFAFFMFYLVLIVLGDSFGTGTLKKEGEYEIYVRTNGVHTDLIFPVKSDLKDWTQFIPKEAYPKNKKFDYIAIGWGDKGFFLDTPTWDDLTFSTAFNAAFLPSSTAMHVEYMGKPKENNKCAKIYISKEQYLTLIKFATGSFNLKGGKVDLIPNKGYTSRDNFYEAKESYHMFKTCNRWTNKALQSAGIKTGWYILFEDGIMRHFIKSK